MTPEEFEAKRKKINKDKAKKEIKKHGQTKAAARAAIKQAIEQSIKKRPKVCEQCGKNPGLMKNGRARLQAHHMNGYDADKKMDVTWLCPPCHYAAHHGTPNITKFPKRQEIRKKGKKDQD